MTINRTALTIVTAGDDITLTQGQDFGNAINNLKAGAVDTDDGNIKASDVTIDSDATSTGDRSLIFKLTASLSRIFKYKQSTGRMRLEDQAGALVPLDVADATQSTSAATKGQLDTAVAGIGYTTARRTTVLNGSRDANGKANFLSAGSGLQAAVAATATPLRLSFANGYGAAGEVNLFGSISADTTVNSLTANATNYILASIDTTTKAISLAKTLLRLNDGPTEPTRFSIASLFHMNNSAVDSAPGVTRTWTANGGATFGSSVKQFGSHSSDHSSAGRYWTASDQTPFQPGTGDFEISYWVYPITSTGFVYHLGQSTSTGSLGYICGHSVVSGTIRPYMIWNGGGANQMTGTTTSLTANSWNQVVWSRKNGTLRVRVGSTWDATTATTSTNVTCATNFTIGRGGDVTSSTGLFHIDEVRVVIGNTIYDTASTTVQSAEWNGLEQNDGYYYYNTSLKQMFLNTAGVWAATANPTQFIGEAVTDGSSVTSAVSYAYNGESAVSQASLATSQQYSISHNIGSTEVDLSDLYLECVTTEQGYAVGERIPLHAVIAGSNSGIRASIKDRNTVRVSTSSSNIGTIVPAAGGATATITAANWKLGGTVKRKEAA